MPMMLPLRERKALKVDGATLRGVWTPDDSVWPGAVEIVAEPGKVKIHFIQKGLILQPEIASSLLPTPGPAWDQGLLLEPEPQCTEVFIRLRIMPDHSDSGVDSEGIGLLDGRVHIVLDGDFEGVWVQIITAQHATVVDEEPDWGLEL